MAFLTLLPNGLGQSSADSLAVNAPFYTTGLVWYVHHTGTDAVAPAGRNATAPLATLAQAQTNASSGDVIVLMDGHTETLGLDLTKRLTIVGGGESDGRPTVKLTPVVDTYALRITGDGIDLRNVWLKSPVALNDQPVLRIQGSRFSAQNCYFECDTTIDEQGSLVSCTTAETSILFKSCTWESVAATGETPPWAGMLISAALTNVLFVDCILDGGTRGFGCYWALDLSGEVITDLRIENVTMLRGADIQLESTTSGYVGGVTATGSAVIDFQAAGA